MTLRAFDEDIPADELRFSLGDGARGVSIDPVSGELSGRPRKNRGGNYDISVIVTDDGRLPRRPSRSFQFK